MEQLAYTSIPPELLQAVLDNPYEGMVIIDREGIVRHFSKANETIYGVPTEKALGQHILQLVPNSRLHIVARTGKAEIGETFNARGRQVVVSRYPIKKDGKIIGAVGKAILHNLRVFEDLKEKIRQLQKTVKRYEQDIAEPHKARYTFDSIIGASSLLQRAKEMARRLAATESAVLLIGESGTGKELFAHALHQASSRKNHPFVRVNCASIPSELFESELFGYAPGAFTGASRAGKPGKFELADKGSIFLDEIGELPLSMQAKLLRVLQEKEVERLGDRRPKIVDFRVVAATNKDLEERVKEGYFRADLYYRLNVVSLRLPALREMKEDIPLLVDHFMAKLQPQVLSAASEISPEVMAAFLSYHWPGNIRELENVIERALNLCTGRRITLNHLPESLIRGRVAREEKAPETASSLQHAVKNVEREQLLEVLSKTKGNKSKAARILNIHRTTLYYKLRKHNLV